MILLAAMIAGLAPVGADGNPRTVILSATINTKGRAERCEVTNPTEDAAVDEWLCATLLKRGRWKPALDDRGRPIASRIEVPVQLHKKP